MANKFKSVFSKGEYIGKIKFNSEKDLQEFINAIKIVQEKGDQVEICNFNKFESYNKKEEFLFPILTSHRENIKTFSIAPSKKDFFNTYSTSYGDVEFKFKVCKLKNKIMLETSKDEPFYFKLLLNDNDNVSLDYEIQPGNTNTTVDFLKKAEASKLFIYDFFEDENISENPFLKGLICIIDNLIYTINNLKEIESILNLTFDLSFYNEEMDSDIKIIHSLIIEKKVFKFSGKIDLFDVVGSKKEDLTSLIGKKIPLVFKGEKIFNICENEIRIYLVQVLINAILDSFEENNENTKIYYRDTDEEPMYIAFTGFLTEEERNEEANFSLKNIDKYLNATTI